jgi:pseudouridine synthase
MGYKVKPGDVVNFDGAVLTPERKEYIVLNKPKNFTTSNEDDADHRNVLELVRGATNAKIQPIGRMDKNTTGLLVFTNDTDMVRKFSLPNQKSTKIYQVSLDKNLKYEDLEKIAIEIKSFRSASEMKDLEEAVGQFVLYEHLLTRYEPERKLYLAVPEDVRQSIFEEEAGQVLIEDKIIRLFSFNVNQAEVVVWIT